MPGRQRRTGAEERPTTEERPTDPGLSRSSIAITNRPRGTLLTRKYIAKGRFWEPSLWAMHRPARLAVHRLQSKAGGKANSISGWSENKGFLSVPAPKLGSRNTSSRATRGFTCSLGRRACLSTNGKAAAGATPGQYLSSRRRWWPHCRARRVKKRGRGQIDSEKSAGEAVGPLNQVRSEVFPGQLGDDQRWPGPGSGGRFQPRSVTELGMGRTKLRKNCQERLVDKDGSKP